MIMIETERAPFYMALSSKHWR